MEKILNKKSLTIDDLVKMLTVPEKEAVKIFEKAAEIRNCNFKDPYEKISLLQISNYCEDECLLCGENAGNNSLNRFRLEPKEIITTAKQIINKGIKTIILSSGIDTQFDSDLIAHLIYSIKDIAEARVILNLGLRQMNEFVSWKIAGADGYILMVETFDEHLFRRYIHPGKQLNILSGLNYLKQIGFNTGSGLLFGFPDQPLDSIANDLLKISEQNHMSLSLQPYKTINADVKKNVYEIEKRLFMRISAISRILNPKAEIYIPSQVITDGYIDFDSLLTCGVNRREIIFTPTDFLSEESTGEKAETGAQNRNARKNTSPLKEKV